MPRHSDTTGPCLDCSPGTSGARFLGRSRFLGRWPSLPRAIALVALAILISPIPACDQKPRLLAGVVAQSGTNRSAAAASIAGLIRRGKLSSDEVLTLAHDKLAAGEDATPFAGAVLDALVLLDGELADGGEFEIFYRRIGRLALAAAMRAIEKERFDEAAELVFAGPKRWQTEAYWLRYTDHDALASMLLARTGKRREAVDRLRSRPVLEGDAAEAMKALTGGE